MMATSNELYETVNGHWLYPQSFTKTDDALMPLGNPYVVQKWSNNHKPRQVSKLNPQRLGDREASNQPTRDPNIKQHNVVGTSSMIIIISMIIIDYNGMRCLSSN